MVLIGVKICDRDFSSVTAGFENESEASYIHASKEVAKLTEELEGDEKTGAKIILKALEMCIRDRVKRAEIELESVKIEDEVTDVICEECGRNMVITYGPHGKFLACPGFPECRNTKPYLEKIGVPCPVCGKDVVIRKIGRAHV